jgi:hypothetical protein
MFAVPTLFVTLFNSLLGNLILFGLIGLATIYNFNLGMGLALVFLVLYRFSHMTMKIKY